MVARCLGESINSCVVWILFVTFYYLKLINISFIKIVYIYYFFNTLNFDYELNLKSQYFIILKRTLILINKVY